MRHWSRSWKTKFLIGILAMILLFLLNCCLGSANLTLQELGSAIFHRETAGAAGNIFWLVRLPRICAAACAGAGLAVAGAILQSVLANPLASPNIIGVNAGAGLGLTIYAACAASWGIVSGLGYSLAAFAGSLAAAFLLTTIAARVRASKTTVILGGVALNSILNAMTESIVTLDKDLAALHADFRVGGLSGVSSMRLIPAAVLILIGILAVLTLTNELDVMLLGDETAHSIGLNTRKYRVIFIVLAALLAGASVSFAGLLGFVGLIVPHFIRRICGNENRMLIPFCIVYGASWVLLCDLAARMLLAPFELPVGIIMAIIGGPCFVWVLLHEKGGHHHA